MRACTKTIAANPFAECSGLERPKRSGEKVNDWTCEQKDSPRERKCGSAGGQSKLSAALSQGKTGARRERDSHDTLPKGSLFHFLGASTYDVDLGKYGSDQRPRTLIKLGIFSLQKYAQTSYFI